MSAVDARAIVARLHRVRARREPSRLRCRQDAAALRQDLRVLVAAATALRQDAATSEAVRRLLRAGVRTAVSAMALPDQDGEQESVERLAAATAKLLRAVTRRPVPPQPVLPADRLARLLRRRIATGRYPPGAKIPARTLLMANEKASASTVAEAVRQLKAQELLVAVQGSGTWVALTAPARLTATGRLRQGSVR
ncbi:GntR family transcriptional regulator [Streptomyces sp. CA-294286]|uniref:GntR family transcriptional regulator n=1 Tax=Streptomyces sp. CA-294286 TaxID=3240070 RepID=UPI003D90695D